MTAPGMIPPGLASLLQRAVQDLVDRTGLSPHDLALLLQLQLEQRQYGMTSPRTGQLWAARPPGELPEVNERSIENRLRNQAPNDRGSACGQDGGQPGDHLAWAHDVALRLDDPKGVLSFAALSRKHDRAFLESAIQAALAVPHEKIRRSRAALFMALVKAWSRTDKDRPPAAGGNLNP